MHLTVYVSGMLKEHLQCWEGKGANMVRRTVKKSLF